MHLLLGRFEGPIGVLLYLIKTQAMNIFNIPIAVITEQYMDFLHANPTMDFDEVGEYLAMAAQLVEIKALWLIPAMQNRLNDQAQSLEEISEEDPRKPLVEQLLEYEAIKAACDTLESIPMLGRDTFTSGEAIRRAPEFSQFEAPIKGDKYSLAISIEKVLLRFAEKIEAPRVKIKAQKLTIHHKMLTLKKRFVTVTECMLEDLFAGCLNRYELIITFMAILELTKISQLCVEQHELFGPMRIYQGPSFAEELSEGSNPDPKEESELPLTKKPLNKAQLELASFMA